MSEETTASERDWRSAATCQSANPELFFPRVVGISQAQEWVATGRVFDAG
jgi:hypothetical protein